MIQKFEKILNRKELNGMKIDELRAYCKKFKIAPKPDKAMMINNILSHFRNQFNLGNLFFSFMEQTEEEKNKIKERIKAEKEKTKKKKEKKKKIESDIDKLNKKLAKVDK